MTAALFMLLAIGIGAVAGTLDYLRRDTPQTPATAGWIYFVAGKDGPVKIGMSEHDPVGQRLGELRTMSPFPLRVIYKLEVEDRYAAEQELHEELKAHRLHGEWFDRDAAMYTIDHLKGEA